MKREEVTELVDRGINELGEALASGKSERLIEYLAVMGRFPNYSFNNTLLVMMQFPEATLIQGFHAWRKMGRTVKKGEKGIGIIAPMIGKKKEDEASNDDGEKRIFGFKVVHVFDVSQTEGDELPAFASVAGDPGKNIPAIEQLIRSWGIELTCEEIDNGAEGLSKKGAIVISPGMDPAKRMMTLIHEAAHELLHACTERRKETTKTIRETEAEAVAFVVASALGVECLDHSSDYIQLYDGDVAVLTKSILAIKKSSAKILDGIHAIASKDNTAEITA